MVETPLQERWRTLDTNMFHNGNAYLQAKQENKLISVDTVADFAYWIMTSNTQFKDEWNIYDTEHHKYWLKSKTLLG